MPFLADSRCGTWKIELNTGEICGELERMLEKEYTKDINEGSMFWKYVIEIENSLNKCDTMPDFWEWFLDDGEYNNVEAWNDIQDYFKEDIDDSEDDSEDGMSDKEKKELMGNLKFLIDNGKKAYEILGLPMNTDMDTFMSAMNKYRDDYINTRENV